MDRLVSIAAAAALLLSACASTGTRDGMVYRDGSWYSPAGAGRGDYYIASPRVEDYDDPYYFGVGLVPYGGYCPVRYRYCTSFWADAWYGPVYDPFYEPYWYQPWLVVRQSPRPHRRELAERTQFDEPSLAPAPAAQERPTPRPWDERPVRAGRTGERGDSPRPRRRGTLSDGG